VPGCTLGDANLPSTGEESDASWNRGQPFEFKPGKGQVIPGWDSGAEGMKVGGRRKLTIPSAMAYGARGARGCDQAARIARPGKAPSFAFVSVRLRFDCCPPGSNGTERRA
jgi:FKBP-type peptidyl-prolyl cis-trans isomerase